MMSTVSAGYWTAVVEWRFKYLLDHVTDERVGNGGDGSEVSVLHWDDI